MKQKIPPNNSGKKKKSTGPKKGFTNMLIFSKVHEGEEYERQSEKKV